MADGFRAFGLSAANRIDSNGHDKSRGWCGGLSGVGVWCVEFGVRVWCKDVMYLGFKNASGMEGV